MKDNGSFSVLVNECRISGAVGREEPVAGGGAQLPGPAAHGQQP